MTRLSQMRSAFMDQWGFGMVNEISQKVRAVLSSGIFPFLASIPPFRPDTLTDVISNSMRRLLP
jgi:hypothetical protein